MMSKNSTAWDAPRPFLKWVGGKRQLLPELLKAVAAAGPFRRYHEPLLGGGALFFELARNHSLAGTSYLSDANTSLIEAYLGVRDNVEAVIRLLKGHKKRHSKDYFYEVRASVPRSPTKRAARTIYLNKTCFNGLHRENSKGLFNAPMGKYKNPLICDEENLRAVSRALLKATIDVSSFENVLERAKRGDLVYFDPPYHPLSKTAFFTAYSKGGFNEDSQRRLSEVFATLARRGVRVMLSNSKTELIRELYADFYLTEVMAMRQVNSKADARGKIPELLVTSFPLEAERGIAAPATEGRLTASGVNGAKGRGGSSAVVWLRQNNYSEVADRIEAVIAEWRAKGLRTRRNWWDVLAGDGDGNPCTIAGRQFPVLRAAQLRQGFPVTENALCRNPDEAIPASGVTNRVLLRVDD